MTAFYCIQMTAIPQEETTTDWQLCKSHDLCFCLCFGASTFWQLLV